jgi:hypothetical protein
VVDDHDVVGQLVGLLQVLRGQEERAAGVDQFAYDRPQLGAAAGVEAGGRLVEEQDGDIRHECAGEIETSAHPPGVGLRGPIGGGVEVETLEQLPGTARRPPPAEVVEPADHLQVLEAGEVLVDRRVLAGDADALPDPGRFGHHVGTGDRRSSSVGSRQGGQDRHGRGLPSPVRTEQADHGALGHSEVKAVEGPHGPVGLHEAPGLDNRSHRFLRRVHR